MKKYFFLLCLLTVPTILSAQVNNAADLQQYLDPAKRDSLVKVMLAAYNKQKLVGQAYEQRNPKLFEKLRKTYESVVVHPLEDGKWEIRVFKDQMAGLIDSTGQVIVPCKYSSIDYIPGLAEGYSTNQFQKQIAESTAAVMGTNSTFEEKVWHKKTPATYLAKKTEVVNNEYITHFSIYSTEGKVLLNNVEGDPEDIAFAKYPGYIIFKSGGVLSDKNGLCTTDGVIILPAKYKDFKIKGKVCYMHAWDEEIGMFNKCGAAMLDNSLKPVPCEYTESDISFDEAKNSWSINKVKRTDYDLLFNKPAQVGIESMEELFKKFDYRGCIRKGLLCANKCDTSVTDRFYLGMSIYHVLSFEKTSAVAFLKTVQNNRMDEKDGTYLDVNRKRFLNSYVDLKALLPLYNICQKFLESYLKNADSSDKNARSAKTQLRLIEQDKKYIATETQKYEEQWALYVAENKKRNLATEDKWNNSITNPYQILFVATAYGIIPPETALYELLYTNDQQTTK